ncbi:MAG TPA: DUF2189 domain-containing protein [Burkholderiaceae bacterium]
MNADRANAPVRVLTASQPLAWLARGWRDFLRAPGPSLLHGALFLVAGLSIVLAGWGRAGLLAGAFSGFLLVAPILVAGLYEVSRRLARGELPSLRDALGVWIEGGAAMFRLGLLLGALGTLWVALSTVIILGTTRGAHAGVEDFLREFVLSPNWLPFALWLAAGGMLAALVFALTVVSAPMMLDREVGLADAALTSVRAVGANPAAMAVWAALVMAVTLAGIALVLPMIVLVPVLGHATWHAYTDTVDASGLAPRL